MTPKPIFRCASPSRHSAQAQSAQSQNLKSEENDETQSLLRDTDLIVTSPGIPPSNPLLSAATSSGIPIFSEVELVWQLRGAHGGEPAKWLCVTGTNGKTTTVGMLESIINASGQQARAVGNIGRFLN